MDVTFFLHAPQIMQKQGHASWRAALKAAPWRLVAAHQSKGFMEIRIFEHPQGFNK
ncbi:hypothetical protein ACIOZM_22160 [Pseudomonas sp. NPDC087346]|uniref:hypothetical protein n=1 Tax=Pseudomonas sp. NPDC087346 TaxID=3364438 RepID=UPI0037F7D34C